MDVRVEYGGVRAVAEGALVVVREGGSGSPSPPVREPSPSAEEPGPSVGRSSASVGWPTPSIEGPPSAAGAPSPLSLVDR
ncbi:hypothetical protein QD712_16160 [Streptomyces acidiscabies]|uniref:hypothetical protein n=1 Tax=Streptomyces acidiscabies TaxID=42234 RepID=UPI0030D06F00